MTNTDISEPVFTHQDLISAADTAAKLAESALDAVREAISGKVVVDGRPNGAAMEKHQYLAHGLSWIATYTECLRQMTAWARRLDGAGAFGEVEALILRIGTGEYTTQLVSGIPMSQNEIIRLSDFGIEASELPGYADTAAIRAHGNTETTRMALAQLLYERGPVPSLGALGLDEEYDLIRDQFRRFADDRVLPFAHEWHLKDELIPMELIEEMSELGVFRSDHPRGIRRVRHVENRHVRGLRRAFSRIHRCRLTRHPLRNRRRTHPLRRHAGAKGKLAAENRLR